MFQNNTLVSFAHKSKLAACIFNERLFIHSYYRKKETQELSLELVHISCIQILRFVWTVKATPRRTVSKLQSGDLFSLEISPFLDMA